MTLLLEYFTPARMTALKVAIAATAHPQVLPVGIDENTLVDANAIRRILAADPAEVAKRMQADQDDGAP